MRYLIYDEQGKDFVKLRRDGHFPYVHVGLTLHEERATDFKYFWFLKYIFVLAANKIYGCEYKVKKYLFLKVNVDANFN